MHKYACKHCQEQDISTPIQSAGAEPAVIKGSIAAPEAIAHIMTQKFVMYSPLYRQEQEYYRVGVPLSRQTMSNWLLKQDILHADGYQACYKIPDITVAACWAHVRRKYEEALKGASEKYQDKLSNIQRGKRYCDALFAIESQIHDLPPGSGLQRAGSWQRPFCRSFTTGCSGSTTGPSRCWARQQAIHASNGPGSPPACRMAGWRSATTGLNAASSPL